jgi:cleavage stimulation factor subunit 3
MLGEDYSAPSGTSQMQSTAMNLGAVPPASTSSFTAPAETRPSENNATAMPAERGLIRPEPTQVPSNVPRLKGGFVIDDDDDDDDNGDVNEEDEGKDILDVYDTPEESKAEIVDLAPVSEAPIDSSSVSHVPIHDAAQISVEPVPVSNGASGVTVSSFTSLPAANVTAQRGSTVTPIQTSSNPQASVVPPSNSVISTPVSAAPRSRLAHDTIGILEDRIKDDPRGDMAAWLELIEELKGRNKKEDVRRTYDRFFKTFPMAVRNPAHLLVSYLMFCRLSSGSRTQTTRMITTNCSLWNRSLANRFSLSLT